MENKNWIDINTQLPEMEKRVIFYDAGKYEPLQITIGKFVAIRKWGKEFISEAKGVNGDYVKLNPTHWMLLPENPYHK